MEKGELLQKISIQLFYKWHILKKTPVNNITRNALKSNVSKK